MQEQEAFVSYISSGPIARILFYHPRHNALPSDLLNKLVEAFDQANREEEVRVVLLQSEGERSFCAGANFDELLSIANEEQGKAFFSGFGRVILAIRACQKPVIARIQGKAVGGGVGLLAAADLAFGTRQAALRLSELSIGIGPFVIGPAVERKAGMAVYSRMAMQPDQWLSAESAREAGLLTEIFDDIQSLDQFLDGYLQQLASYSPQALGLFKQSLWEGTDHWPEWLAQRAALSGKLVLSEHTRLALNRFKSKP